MAFHEAAIDIRQDLLVEKKEDDAVWYDVWALIAIRYGLRVTGMRCEFYKLAAKDPTYATWSCRAWRNARIYRCR